MLCSTLFGSGNLGGVHKPAINLVGGILCIWNKDSLDISSKEEELLVLNFSVFYSISEKQIVVCNSGNLMLVAGSLQVEICNSGLQLPA